jgi:hypothetical protein
MDFTLVRDTTSGMYGVLRRAALAVGLDLSLEAHAYLNQDDDEDMILDFYSDKLVEYGSEKIYYEALGAKNYDDLEEKMANALNAIYFRRLPLDKLRKATMFLRERGKSGCTILETVITRAAYDALDARTGEFAVPTRGLNMAFMIFLFLAYYASVQKNAMAVFLFVTVAMFTIGLRVALYLVERREYVKALSGNERLGNAEMSKMRQAVSEMLGRFFPGFEW